MTSRLLIGGMAALVSVVALPAVVQAAPVVVPKVPPSAPTVTDVVRDVRGGAAYVTASPATDGIVTTSIRVTATPSGKGCTIKLPATDCRVAGLVNGTSYTFTAVASGPTGKSTESTTSAPLTVARAPFRPTQVRATAAVGGEATLTWTPAADGGLPISGFEVTGSGGQNCTTAPPVTSCQFTGLTPGLTYNWTIVARNEVGASLAATSNTIKAIGAKRPGAPTITGVERAGDGRARVTAVPGLANGAPVTRIVVRTDALRADGTYTRMATVWCAITLPGDSCVITGLTNGNSYRFVAENANIAGTSVLSPQTDPFQPGL